MGDTLTAVHGDQDQEPPTLGGIDHVEWWVGNARAFSGFLA
jgi:hypothetical protein